MRFEAPGATVVYNLGPAPTGMVGTLAIRLNKVVAGGPDVTVVARSTAVVEEDPAGSGLYQGAVTLPLTPGDYYPLWDNGTTFTRDDEITRVSFAPSEIAGIDAPYFTVDEFRAHYLGDARVAELTDDQIEQERATAEEIIEHESNVAFVPRTSTLTIDGDNSTGLKIPLYLVREINSIDIDGAAQDIDSYRVSRSGVVFRDTAWPRNVSNVVVEVVHGYDSPPRRIRDAAMTLTYHRAIKGPIDDRATSIPAGEAGGTITLLTPGVGTAITGIPEVDAAIISYRLPKITSVGSVLLADSANVYPPEESWAVG